MCLPGCLAGYWSIWLTGCLSMCLIWLARCLSACLHVRLVGCRLLSLPVCLYPARWLAISLCVLSGWLDACLPTSPSLCQLTGNLLSPRIAKCFAHAQSGITQIPLVDFSLPQTKTAECKEEEDEGKSENKKKRRVAAFIRKKRMMRFLVLS